MNESLSQPAYLIKILINYSIYSAYTWEFVDVILSYSLYLILPWTCTVYLGLNGLISPWTIWISLGQYGFYLGQYRFHIGSMQISM